MTTSRTLAFTLRSIRVISFAISLVASSAVGQVEKRPDINSVAPDLVVPAVEAGAPRAGVRVAVTSSAYAGTAVYHILYLPTNWQPDKVYPVLVEYAGNGNYRNEFSDVSTGEVEGSKLGFGISGGRDFIWLCLPYISEDGTRNEITWWGDAEATVAYAKREVVGVCEQWGGDPDNVILCGFSRGAIACGYIGLYDDEIASLWKGFIAYSHYDGVRKWAYPASDKMAALARLERLGGRPSFVIDEEGGLEKTRAYIESAGASATFTFRVLPFRNHSDAWALRDIPARRDLREWLEQVVE